MTVTLIIFALVVGVSVLAWFIEPQPDEHFDVEDLVTPINDGRHGWRSECPSPCGTVLRLHTHQEDAERHAVAHRLTHQKGNS